MTKSILIFSILFFNITYSQPINYVLNNKTVSIEFKIYAKSKLSIINSKEIINRIKKDATFVTFCSKYNDSIEYEPHSSLMLFEIGSKGLSYTNKMEEKFELNNIVSNFIYTFFKRIKFKNLKENKNFLLGFYLQYIPPTKEFKIEFIEYKNGKYYSIYKTIENLDN